MQISDKYVILERLGTQRKRKFGSVYLGADRSNQSQVVIKAIKKDSKNVLAQTRLRQEATFSFMHIGLPKIIDFHESEQEIILIKGYSKGVTIDLFWKGLKRRQRIQFLSAFTNQLIPIFDHLNARQIVHCDIKPENVLIHGTIDSFEISLIDFGLSIQKDQLEQRNTLFPLGFAAPELLLNELEIITQKSDIYALGILIWRLYTGHLPLTHPNPSIFTNLQLTHPLPDHAELPKKVFSILERMTFKHSFDIPPNKMKQEQVRSFLKDAMTVRSDLSTVATDFSELKTKKFWF